MNKLPLNVKFARKEKITQRFKDNYTWSLFREKEMYHLHQGGYEIV